jgi:tRNA 2-thiouridine synthesizing protein A
MSETPRPDDAWDAGGLGCGELVIVLWGRLRALPPGAIFQLTATDPGAVHDIPAWCRLTGHGLVEAAPPRFLIRRKD